MATMTGFGCRHIACQRSRLRRSRVTSSDGVPPLPYSLRSTPALKPLPSPLMPITGAPSPASRSSAAEKASSSAAEKAFDASGRSRTIQSMYVPDSMRSGGRSVISIAASNGIEGPAVTAGRHHRFQDAGIEFPRPVLLDALIVILAVENAVGVVLGV